jgi:hypothetical protein
MKRFGIYLLILGLGSFILPYFDIQFKILSIFGENQWIASILLTVAGAGLLLLGIRKQQQKEA